MILVREVVKVMVEVRLLTRADADEAIVGALVGVPDPAEEPKVAERFAGGFTFGVEDGPRKILDTALEIAFDVVFTKFDEEPTDSVKLLFVVEDNEAFMIWGPGVTELHAPEETSVIVLVKLVIGTAADNGTVGVTLKLDDVLSPRLDVLADGTATVEVFAKLEDGTIGMRLIEKLNPGIIVVAKVELVKTVEVPGISVMDKIDVTSRPDEDNSGRGSETELGFVNGIVMLAIGRIEVALGKFSDTGGEDIEGLAKLCDTTVLGPNAVELREVERVGEDDGYKKLEADNMVVGSDTVVISTILDDRGNGAGTKDEAEGQSVAVLSDCKGTEEDTEMSGNGTNVGRVDEELSTVGSIGDMVTVIVIICPELLRVMMVVSAFVIVPGTGSIRDAVRLALENIIVGLADSEGSSFVRLGCNDEVGNEVTPSLTVVTMLGVVACPAESVVVGMVGYAVVTAGEVATGDAALGMFVGSSVSIVVRVCPSGNVLVVVKGKAWDASDPTPDEVTKETEAGGSAGLGVEVVGSSGRVVASVMVLLCNGVDTTFDGAPLSGTLVVVVKNVIDPPGALLVTTGVVPDTAAGSLVND